MLRKSIIFARYFQDMKKRTIIIATIILMAIQTAMGQIIYTPEDHGTNLREGGNFGVMVPLQNTNTDQWKIQYVPVGNGLLLLVGLGGAYLLQKKKRKE